MRRVESVRNDEETDTRTIPGMHEISHKKIDSPIAAQATREGVLECLLARHGSGTAVQENEAARRTVDAQTSQSEMSISMQ